MILVEPKELFAGLKGHLGRTDSVEGQNEPPASHTAH
jgi:hypothetical protein